MVEAQQKPLSEVRGRAGVGSSAETCRVMLAGGVRAKVVLSLKRVKGKGLLGEKLG